MSREKVLIVDDSALNRQVLREILKKEDIEIFEAIDGNEALEQVEERNPILILLDVMMPLKDGYQVCSEIRSNPQRKDIPIIFLSARAELRDKLKGLELGAVDYITKPFNHREVLARVRGQVTIQKLNRSLQDALDLLQLRQQRIDGDLKAAAQIQRSLIPESFLQIENLSCQWKFLPCDTVGGDIFNVLQLDDEHTAVWMLDVSGHGVSSAMVAVAASQRLCSQSGKALKKFDGNGKYTLLEPSDVISQLNKEFNFERFEKFFTMCYLLVNHRTGQVRYCNAGHPSPLLMQTSGALQELSEGGTLVGIDPDFEYEQGEVQLHAGDRIVIYTDGIVEYENKHGEAYGDEKFQTELKNTQRASLSEVCDQLSTSLEKHAAGADPQDDISILVLEYKNEIKPSHQRRK